ncbi:MAG: DUF3467 domain-containing protein [Deltaproteobacteria bacterium]|nr:DUF3467 domain-containing protein [Deltaproteobacteria bacterium]
MAKTGLAKKREIIRHKANNYTELYSNSAELRATFLDFQISFGKILDATPEKLEIENQFAIIMSPQQTKQLMRVLVDNVAKYEKQHGTIPISPAQKAIEPT